MHSLTRVPHDDNLYDEAKLRLSILCKVDTNYFYKNFLPAFNNLHYIRLVGLANCFRYSNGVENLEHGFRDYSTVKETWQMLNIIWPQAVSELEYKEWLAHIFLNNSIYQCRIVACAI
ncbi:hypothetical protein J1N35_022052 [Gossypium stocksii]|uniref:Uncharacterized protein n=1 Tax=Gossypium stocksii TaxID=47602 RepID=A0A9D3VGG1_9ROSI|nr:hypothetical protein J1N35_022052 [Gossypium stocksii]